MLISDEDLSSAIAVDMYVYNVLVPKSRNADIVEYGDVVKVYIDINYSRGEKEVIIVDDGSDVGAGLSGSGW